MGAFRLSRLVLLLTCIFYASTQHTRRSHFGLLPFSHRIRGTHAVPTAAADAEDANNNEDSRAFIDQTCSLCNVVLRPLFAEIRAGASKEQVTASVVNLCVSLKLQTERVCRGLTELNVEQIMFIVKNRPKLSARQMCGLVFQVRSCASDKDLSDFDFTINVDEENKKELTSSKDSSVAPGPNDLTIVHITDPHYDPRYEVGSLADCVEPSCCRNDQPVPANRGNESIAAERWGDYRKCDSPHEVVEDAYTHISREHQQIDFVYFTGDIVDHGIWNTTQEGNKQIIRSVNNLMASAFVGIPVYPVLGNHESHPLNLFAPRGVPEQFSTQWLFDFIAEEWAKWLPESALETVRIGGYYSVLIRPGLRLIATNMNECSVYNWWVMYDASFFFENHLQWIHDTLLEAEKAGEKVHILSHTPSGDYTCLKFYGREFTRIVERFWDTISGQFVGHTHLDEFNIYYSTDSPQKALNVAWNAGSTTTYNDLNPNYRVYKVDAETFQVNGHETWIYNVTEANLTPEKSPRWYLEYDLGKEFGIDSLSPASLDGLAESLARNPDKLKRYSELKVKLGDPALKIGCDGTCEEQNLCDMVTTAWAYGPRCTELLEVRKNGN